MDDPEVSIDTENNMACAGGTIELEAIVTGSINNCSIEWQNADTDEVLGNGAEFMLSVPTAQTLNIKAVVTDCTGGGGGCMAESAPMEIMFVDDPGISITPTEPMACAGGTVQLQAVLEGDKTNCSVEWLDADTDAFLGSGSDLLLSRTTAQTVNVKAVVTSCIGGGGGCMAESTPVAVMFVEDPEIRITPAQPSACIGGTVQLEATITGDKNICTLEWRDADTDQFLGSGLTLDVSRSVIETVRVKAIVTSCNGGSGCNAVSEVVEVNFVADPTIGIVPLNPRACVGGTVNLTAVVTNGDDCMIEWRNANTTELLGTGSSLEVSRQVAEQVEIKAYVISCTLGGCDAESGVSTVTFIPDPEISISPSSATACLGGTINLSYQLINNPNECDIEWRNADTEAVLGTGPQLNISRQTAQLLRVKAVIVGCNPLSDCTAESNVAEINFIENPQISISPESPMACAGGTISLQAELTGSQTSCSVEWRDAVSNDLLGTGLNLELSRAIAQSVFVKAFILDCTGNFGCSAESSVKEVQFIQDPNISVSGENLACVGASVTLTANLDHPKEPCSLQWQEKLGDDWINIPNQTQETLTVQRNSANTYAFRVLVTSCDGGSGCDATSPDFLLEFVPDPIVTVTSPNNSACEGGSVTLQANIQQAQGICLLQWEQKIGDNWVALDGETNSTLQVVKTDENTYTYTYRAVVTSCAGGADCNALSDPYDVVFLPDPSLSISGANIACVDGTLQLTAAISNPNGNNCLLQWQELTPGGWENLDGETDNTLDVSKSDADDYSFRVLLISCDGGNGCDATSDAYVVTFASEPTVQLLPSNTSICSDATVAFSASLEGGSGCTQLTYLIKRAGETDFTPILSSNADTDQGIDLPADLPDGFLLTPGAYTIRAETICSVTNCFGADESTLIVRDKPVLSGDFSTNVCSDTETGIVFSTINPDAPNVQEVLYKITAIDSDGLTPTGGNPLSAIGQLSGDQVIKDDVWLNTGTSQAVVQYTIVPVFKFGETEFCEGNSVDVEVAVRPQPDLSDDLDVAICSESPTALTLLLMNPDAEGISDTYFIITAIESNGLVAYAGDPVANPGNLKDASEIADDAWINKGTDAVDVVYSIIPVFQYGVDDYCYGEEETLTLSVKPAPVMNEVAPLTVCSPGDKLDEGVFGTGITLSVDNDPNAPGNQAPMQNSVITPVVQFRLDAISGAEDLIPGLGNATQGSIGDENLILYDSWINETENPITLTYRITPIIVYNEGTEEECVCYGDFRLIELTVMPSPSIDVAMEIVGVDYPSSQTCGQFDIIMDVEICNNGSVKVKDLDVDIDLSGMSNGILVGLVGRPVWVEGVQLDNDLNANFNGVGLTDLFDGQTASLDIGQCTKYRIRFEVAPDAVTPELATNALFKTSVIAPADWSGITETPFDENTECYPPAGQAEIALGDCWERSRIFGANNLINVVMDENCQALITPDMILEGHKNECDLAGFPLGGFYRLVVIKPGNIMEGPFTRVVLNAEDFNDGRAIVQVENVSSFCYPVWGELRLEDRTDPEFGPYEDLITHIEVDKDVQKISGSISGADPDLRLRDYSCFIERSNLPNCDNDYQTLSFKVDKEDIYTIEMGIDEALGMVALYQNGFDPDQPCSNIIAQNDVPLSGDALFEPGDAAGRIRMVLPLDPEITYTLLIASTDCDEDADDFTIYFHSDGDGTIIEASSNVEATEVKMRYPLLCTDVDQILDQESSTLIIPGPPVLSDCTPNSKWFEDQLITSGDCGDIRIHRTWYVRDEKGREGTPVVQVIKFVRPGLEDIYKPATTVAIECNELTTDMLDDNGNPNPEVTGYPFIVSAYGIFDLKPSICNIGASYRELGDVDVCDNTRQIIREWTLVDWCDNGSQDDINNSTLINHRQIIYIGDFTAPVVEQPANEVINTSPFGCSGTLQIAPLNVTDNCSSTILITAKVFKKRQEPILDKYGRETGEFMDVFDLVHTGSEGDNVSGIELGFTYIVEYAVEDACGNETQPVSYEVNVIDQVEPTTICNNDLNISVGGNGLGRVHADDVDEGSSDNCALKAVLISRKLENNNIRDAYLDQILGISFSDLERVNQSDPSGDISEIWVLKSNNEEQILRRKQGMWFTWWQDDQWFICEDIGADIRIELVAIDIFDNANVCWLDVVIEDKVRPFCIPPAPVELNCTDLPFGFDPQDDDQLLELFGNATATDNCSATAASLSKTVVWDCNSGTITRFFRATDGQGLTSLNTCSQLVTINPVHDYEIKFPKDVEVECGVPMPDTIQTKENACGDQLTVSVFDEPFTATDGACYKIRRTYKVINWCTYDTQAEPVLVPRDADCDGTTGEEDVYVLVRPNGLTYIDRDNDESSSPSNSPCRNGAKGHYTNSNIDNDLQSVGFWQYSQFIKINDNTPPDVRITDEQTFCSISNDCRAEVELALSVSDFCAGDQVSVKVFLLPDVSTGLPSRMDLQIAANAASVNFQRSGSYPDFILSARLPLGDHQFEIVVEDGCLNSTLKTVDFSVIDCKAPSPICIDGLAVELMRVEPGVDADGDGDEDYGYMTIMASDFRISGLSDCSEPVSLSINRVGEAPDPNQKSLIVTCDDTDTVRVEVYTWDSAYNPTRVQPNGQIGGPNYDHCTTYVVVQDNLFGLCSGGGPAISGLIVTEEDYPVENVEVNLTGGLTTSMITRADGIYSFEDLPLGADYTVTPLRDDYPLNGVNTLDLIFITKHLLRTRVLDSPYKLIAADVDRSRSVTALDLIHLRKLLLTVYDDFPSGPSWRFLAADYSFPNPNFPFAEELPEVLNYNDLPALIDSAHFMGIKLGDVNGSVIPNSTMGEIRNTAGSFDLEVLDQDLKAGNEYKVSFSARDLERIQGYQFTLDFEARDLELVDIEYGLANAENFGLHRVEEGVITSSWNYLEVGSLPDQTWAGRKSARPNLGGSEVGKVLNQSLFTLIFRARTDAKLSNLMRLSSRYTATEAYNFADETLQMRLRFGNQVQEAAPFELYQNAPNPWNDQTVIGFSLPEATAGTLSLRDVQGRILQIIRGEFALGYNQITLDKQSLPNTGVLYYTLETDSFAATKKMVLIE